MLRRRSSIVWFLLSTPFGAMAAAPTPPISLPTGQYLEADVAGQPERTNSFPSSIAVSPDGRTLAVLANGYGTIESGMKQSIVLVDGVTGVVTDVADDRLGIRAPQTAFEGLAFSSDGRELYVSFASLSAPDGGIPGATGNGVAVYAVGPHSLTPSRFLPIAATPIPYPAGLAVLPGRHGDRLLVAANLSDEAILVDAVTGSTLARVSLGDGAVVPALFPFGAIAAPTGRSAWISLWNGSAVAQLDLRRKRLVQTVALEPPDRATDPGSHPTAMVMSRDGRRLFVALANADAVAVVDTHTGQPIALWSTRVEPGSIGGSIPDALALSADGERLFVALAGANAVAVLDADSGAALGFIPTQWYPTALAVVGDDLFVAAGKGVGTGPNPGPGFPGTGRAHPYIASLLHGSLARIDLDAALSDLDSLTAEVLRSNRVGEVAAPPFAGPSPVRHVIYVIKENRTYDQVLGDLEVGDGDASLVLYGEDITPNQHALAREFGVLDRFYCSGEISGGGHVWSTAATSTDYTERTWQIAYRSNERDYDYEGQVRNAFPVEQGIADVDEPSTGFLWANAERHGLTRRNFGEYVASVWCDDPSFVNPGVLGTPLIGGGDCPRAFVAPGEPLPGHEAVANPWPWPIPVLARNVPTKIELRDHASPDFADFRMDYPDQLRADTFLGEFQGWVQTRDVGGVDPMPQLVILRLPNDHTAGTRPGFPTPLATIADNDLALGRIVDAVSHSSYWSDTAILVVEDDAQDGADHVDAHRSIAFAISAFSPSATDRPVVDSTFYTTASMLHTLESLLGLPPMNDNDARAPMLSPLFSGRAHAPFTVDTRNRDNGMIYTMNVKGAVGSAESAQMDFVHADSADSATLNAILWADRKGPIPMPIVRGR